MISININAFLFHIDDHCQFWLDETAGVLTSPYFDDIDLYDDLELYGHNLNCIWSLAAAKEGFYINLKIDYFEVYTYKISPFLSK